MRRFVIIPLLILIVFAATAEYAVGWRSLLYPWRFIDNPLYVLAAAALLAITHCIRALRLYRYFRFPSGLLLCLRVLLQHNLFVNILPLRTGELAFPVLMSRYLEVPLQRSLPALVWLRILDLHALLSVMILVVGMLFSWWWAAASAALWVSFPIALLAGSQRAARLFAHRRGTASKLAYAVISAVPNKSADLLEMVLLTLLNWVLKLAVFAWIILLFSEQSFVTSLGGAVGGELTTVLPIQGLAGFGTYEAGIVAALRSLRVPLNEALSGAVNLHFVILGVALLGAVASLLIPTGSASSRRYAAGVAADPLR